MKKIAVKLKKPKDFYNETSPKWSRILGDLLMNVPGFIVVGALLMLHEHTLAVVLTLGLLGKNGMNFVADKIKEIK